MIKTILFILIFTTSLLLADELLMPPEDQKNKAGAYLIDSNSIPEDYQKIWTRSEYNRHKRTEIKKENNKFYKSPTKKFKWKIFTPEKYKATDRPGLLVMPNEYVYEKLPIGFQKAINQTNLILACPQINSAYEFTTEMIFSSIGIVKARYTINSQRIYYCSISARIDHDHYIAKPEVFKGFISVLNPATHEPKDFTRKQLKDLEKFLKRSRYSFIGVEYFDLPGINITYTKEKFDIKNDWKSVHLPLKTLDKDGNEVLVKNLKHNDAFLKMAPTPFIDAINHLDIEIIKKGKEQFIKANDAKAKANFKDALTLYQKAHENLHSTALEEFVKIKEILANSEDKLRKLVTDKNYPKAIVEAAQIIFKFGEGNADFAKLVMKECTTNPKIKLEIKAAKYLSKIESAIVKGLTEKAKIIKALNDVINYSPGSKTAEKAKSILDKLK